MTTYEQELTLFGGWARVQIPPQIELGVEKTSVTPSVSIYISSEWNEEPITFEQLARFMHTGIIKIETEIDQTDIEIKEARVDPMTRQEFTEDIDPTKRTEVRNGFANPSRWVQICHRIWVDRAFLRFFEIWQRGTLDAMMRGLAGREQLRKSFSGMVGGNYNGGVSTQKKPLTKLPSGEWALSNDRPLYPDIKRLPEQGKQHARTLARKIRQQAKR